MGGEQKAMYCAKGINCEGLVLRLNPPVHGLAGMEFTFFIAGPYGTVLWICDQNSVDNTLVFWLLLNSNCAASRPSVSHSALAASRLGVCKQLGGDTAGTADLN